MTGKGEKMGMFVNPGNEAFAVALNSEIYVDKTGLLIYKNKDDVLTYLIHLGYGV